MKYAFRVKHNGIYYEPGVEIDEATPDLPSKEEKTVKTDEKPTIPYTRTEITRMKTAKVRELAGELGIANADEMTANELKALIMEKM